MDRVVPPGQAENHGPAGLWHTHSRRDEMDQLLGVWFLRSYVPPATVRLHVQVLQIWQCRQSRPVRGVSGLKQVRPGQRQGIVVERLQGLHREHQCMGKEGAKASRMVLSDVTGARQSEDTLVKGVV